MTDTEITSKAWRWPSEWIHERAFWRDVASRTVAAVLTVIIIAVPGLIYAIIYGVITRQQVFYLLASIGATGVIVLSVILSRNARLAFKYLRELVVPDRLPIGEALLLSFRLSFGVVFNGALIYFAFAIAIVLVTLIPTQS